MSQPFGAISHGFEPEPSRAVATLVSCYPMFSPMFCVKTSGNACSERKAETGTIVTATDVVIRS